MYVKMYRFPYEKFKVGIFEIIIMQNMKIRISILQTTDFDQTLSGPQSTHSKHILFSDDRNLIDRFFIHLRWRFLIILISKSTELLFRKINSENFIRKSIHLYIHNHFTTYYSTRASWCAVIRPVHPMDHECKAAHKFQHFKILVDFQGFTCQASWSRPVRRTQNDHSR